MAKNKFGTQPVVSVQKPKGGGGGNRNPGRAGNQGAQDLYGAGQGGGGKNQVPATGLYTGKAGEAASNQDPEQFVRDILGASGMTQDTGTTYGAWANDQLVQNIMRDYNARGGTNQAWSPEDYIRATYGAGWTTTGKKKNKTTTFNQGTLGNEASDLPDQYQDFLSNQDPATFLRAKGINAGGIIENGGNSDFQDFFNERFAPGVQGQLEGARMNGAQTPTSVVPPDQSQYPAVTKPVGEDPQGRGKRGRMIHFRGQGKQGAAPGSVTASQQTNPPAAAAAGAQATPPVTASGGRKGGGGGQGKKGEKYNPARNPAPLSNPVPNAADPTGGPNLSLNDFTAGRDLMEEARNAYAFRPNAQRLPGATQLAGRYSWWD